MENIKINVNEQPERVSLIKTQQCYPNNDSKVWLRSCEHEIIEPINGIVTGNIPNWLNGSLLRNGPGSVKVGDMQFKHLFDCSALLHRFSIKNGNVRYQCRFIQTDSLKKNRAANRIVITEFGTRSVPDPCHTIFDRISTFFKPHDESDNTMISIYPFGDEFFSFTEGPVIHKIEVDTLETKARINVAEYVGIVNHTSHPHILNDGTIYNMGLSVTHLGPCYNVICFPNGNEMIKNAYIVATIPVRWKCNPSYMHTFGITENYYIIVEQPLTISLTKMVKRRLFNRPMVSCFKWFPNENTFIYLICRKTCKIKQIYKTDTFFYLHIINQYEKDNKIFIDICCYKDPGMLECMYIEAMENLQQNPNYASHFRGKPLRFILPIVDETDNGMENIIKENATVNSNALSTILLKLRKFMANIKNRQCFRKENCNKTTEINLDNVTAENYIMKNGSIYCKSEQLCDLGCETPRIFYDKYSGKEYQYFYAISSDVDALNPGTLIKVDVKNKTKMVWCETNCYPSEPIFVPSPDAKAEDDGVILSAIVWGNNKDNKVALIVLSAKDMTELGRCEFITPGPVPKCLHGWFAPNR